MKPPSLLIVITTLFFQIVALGQTDTLSKHEFSFYRNENRKIAVNEEIAIIVSGDTTKSKKIDNLHYFPMIDSATKFDLMVKVGSIIIIGKDYPAWMLNKGSTMTFGKVTKLKKLKSVADYNGMSKDDQDWDSYSNRYFVIDRRFTLNIENITKVKNLQFLIMVPNNSSSLLTTQKVIWKNF